MRCCGPAPRRRRRRDTASRRCTSPHEWQRGSRSRACLQPAPIPIRALPDGETALMTAARTGERRCRPVAARARRRRERAEEPAKGQTALDVGGGREQRRGREAADRAPAPICSERRRPAFSPFLFAVAAGTWLRHGAARRRRQRQRVAARRHERAGAGAINAHYELASFLLDRGANPNADGQGWTALHQIAWSRRHNAGFNLPGPVPTGRLDSLDLVRKLVAARRRRQRASEEGTARRQPQPAESHWRDAVPARRQVRRRAADEGAARAAAPTPRITTNNGTTALMAAAGVGIWAPARIPGRTRRRWRR